VPRSSQLPAAAGEYKLLAVTPRRLRVLALDTSTPYGSVALADAEVLVGEVRLLSPDSHSSRVLPAAAFLLERVGWTPAELDGFAVTTGPGSFTGLRVGLSTIQGLALAAGRQCLGVPTLDVLASRICGAADRLVAVLDAFRGEFFAAIYDREARPVEEPFVSAPEALVDRVPGGAALIGDAVQRLRERILARRPDALFPTRSPFLAGTLARQAAARLAAGEGIAPEALRPLYLREAQIRTRES